IREDLLDLARELEVVVDLEQLLAGQSGHDHAARRHPRLSGHRLIADPVEPSVPAAIRRHYGQPPEGRQATRRGAGRAVSRPEGARSRAGVRRSATCTLGRSAAATAAPSTRKRRILSGCGASSTAMEDPHGKRTILAPRVPAKLTSPTRAFTPSDRRRRPPETGTTRAVVPAPDRVTPVRRPPRSLRDRVRHRPRLHDRTDHHPA